MSLSFSDDSEVMELFDLEENADAGTKVTSKRELELQTKSFRSIYEIPFDYRHIFRGYSCFNSVQSEVFDTIFNSDEPLVVSAPTGSGKTVLFELAIIRLITQMQQTNQSNFKIIYLAPLKALCSERLNDWQLKFQKHNIEIIALTGDTDDLKYSSFQKLHIVLTTPEKWDSLTRRWKNQTVLVEHIKLFLIDEIHLLNEDNRGSTLETVICRMKTIQHTLYDKVDSIRLIAVSATIPNTDDIATLLRSQSHPAKFFKFNEDHRPVKLNKIVLGYAKDAMSSFKFDLFLNYRLRPLIMKYSDGKPTLIFCSTRRSVELTSKTLAQEITFHLTNEQKQILVEATKRVQDQKLKTFLIGGIGIHHGGLEKETREAIEDCFRKGCLPIIVTTSTLSMGINLPAHLVIIKSTDQVKAGTYQSYSENSILQMIGRAGRPQFDTSATAIIMTKMTDKNRYENLVNGTEYIESNLHKHLVEHINAEVVLNTITDLNVALDWIRSTFLYIRVLKNPKPYSIPANLSTDKIEKKLLELFKIELNALASAGMLTLSADNNFDIHPTDNGILMARFYIAFQTMKLFIKMKGNETLSEILSIICKCHEFADSPLRTSDKKTLNLLNSSKNSEIIRYPMNGKIRTHDMKINCIIQATFGCLSIPDLSLKQESLKIMRIGERLTRALTKYFEHKMDCFSALLNSILLNKCFHVQLWENSVYVSKQLNKIGVAFSSMLVISGKTSFRSLARSDPRDIERIIGRSAPIGAEVKKAATQIPQFAITFVQKHNQDNQFRKIIFEFSLQNVESIKDESTVSKSSMLVLLIGDSENHVMFFKRLTLNFMINNLKFSAETTLQVQEEHLVKAVLISEEFVGIDHYCVVKIPNSEENNNFEEQRDIDLESIASLDLKCDKEPPKKTNKKKTNPKKSNTETSIQKSTKKAVKPVNTIDKYLRVTKKNTGKVKDHTNKTSTTNVIGDLVGTYCLDNESYPESEIIDDVFSTIQSQETEKIEGQRDQQKDNIIDLIDKSDENDDFVHNLDETDFEVSDILKPVTESNGPFKFANCNKSVSWNNPLLEEKMINNSISTEEETDNYSKSFQQNCYQKNKKNVVLQNQVFNNEFIINIGFKDLLNDMSHSPEKKVVAEEINYNKEAKTKSQSQSPVKSLRLTTQIQPPTIRLKDLSYLRKDQLPALDDESFEQTNKKLYDSSLFSRNSIDRDCLMITGQCGDSSISKPIVNSQVFQSVSKKPISTTNNYMESQLINEQEIQKFSTPSQFRNSDFFENQKRFLNYSFGSDRNSSQVIDRFGSQNALAEPRFQFSNSQLINRSHTPHNNRMMRSYNSQITDAATQYPGGTVFGTSFINQDLMGRKLAQTPSTSSIPWKTQNFEPQQDFDSYQKDHENSFNYSSSVFGKRFLDSNNNEFIPPPPPMKNPLKRQVNCETAANCSQYFCDDFHNKRSSQFRTDDCLSQGHREYYRMNFEDFDRNDDNVEEDNFNNNSFVFQKYF